MFIVLGSLLLVSTLWCLMRRCCILQGVLSHDRGRVGGRTKKEQHFSSLESYESFEKKNIESLPIKNDETSMDALRSRKKKREPTEEDDEELKNGELATKRFNWNRQRHKQFVAAVT